MPLELVDLDRTKKVLSPGDRGFIISLSKIRWSKHAASEALKLLKSFAQDYYLEKNADTKTETTEEGGEEQNEEVIEESESNAQTQQNTAQNTAPNTNTGGIVFIHRELVYHTFCFIASNLADPADYAYFIMNQLTDAKKYPKTKFPFRIMPVQAVCEARPKAIERTAAPLIESVFGQNDEPIRFSLMYRGNSEGDYLTQKEAKHIVRNVVWSVNPYCVQCLKYQDYAIVMDIVSPLFCIGIVKDYQKLGGYNTWTIRLGVDPTDQNEDSEDDISDDSTLDEEEDRRRKLRIKRKRRAELAELEAKKKAESGEATEETQQAGNDASGTNEAVDKMENGM